MKKSEILALVQCGVLNATQHSVSSTHAYKVFKLKSVVRKAFEAILEQEKELAKECGIENAEDFDRRRNELFRNKEKTKEEINELEGMNEKFAKFAQMRNELYNEEESGINSIKTMPFEEWRKLQDENKDVETSFGKVDVFSGAVEELLFGVLWKAPEETEEEVA